MLLLSIVIIIGAAVGGLYFAKKEYDKYKLESLKTNMVTLQAKIKVLADEVAIKKEGVEYVGKKISENLEDEDVKALIEKGVIGNVQETEQEAESSTEEEIDYEKLYAGYYILEREDLAKLGASNLGVSKIIVNYNTYEIIYINGFTINDIVYYKLSDFSHLNDKNENVNVNEEETEEEQTEETSQELENNNE